MQGQPDATAEQADERVLHLDVQGMHCVNCSVAIERRFKELPHVHRVSVDYPGGQAVVGYSDELDVATLNAAIGEYGYTVSARDAARPPADASRNTSVDYAEIATVFLWLVAILLVLHKFQLLPRGPSVSDTMSYGLVFVIGLVASVSSCLAVTGGLLVAVAARYNAANPHLTDLERLGPHILFNWGRMLSYMLLGGAVGALGSTLALSPTANGALTILASLVMIVLGLQMLKLFPSLGSVLPTLPKTFAHRIHDLAKRDTRESAFLLGAATFFLPCGFTQALQLYVLAKGDFITGMLTMGAFALGTLPALLSLAFLSSFAKGAVQKHFVRFAGAAVVLLGFMNIKYGLVLTGSYLGPPALSTAAQPTSKAKGQETPAAKGQETAVAVEPQKIFMKIDDLEYLPNQFTVQQGVPVEWLIDGREARGCGRFLLVPRLGIRKLLSGSGPTLVTFTSQQAGEFVFNCGMGMMTPGSKIIVVAKGKG